eukprot:jgi/Astpho2/8359/Aster-01424
MKHRTFDISGRNGGANGSVVFELDRPENKVLKLEVHMRTKTVLIMPLGADCNHALCTCPLRLTAASKQGLKRGLRLIDAAMAELKGTPAEGQVSMADMIALAGAYAVSKTGGPKIEVPVARKVLSPVSTRHIGRQDAAAGDPADRLPAETFTAAQLVESFKRKGFSAQEFVALSGAHTLGNKGFGEPLTFDNTYYKTLETKPWAGPNPPEMAKMIGLPSDHVLPDDPECRPLIQMYADSQDRFFADFAAAYTKLTSLGASWA